MLAALSASLIVTPLLLPAAAPAQDEAPLETVEQRFSYMVGLQIGQGMMQQGVGQNLDVDAFAQALRDTFAGQQSRLTVEEIQATVQEMRAAQQSQQEALGAEAKAAGDTFLMENAKKQGVQTTGSGLQYKVIEEGAGPKPGSGDTVEVHYAPPAERHHLRQYFRAGRAGYLWRPPSDSRLAGSDPVDVGRREV
jgi:FKBP-type peptidyl-prolyl cis-trans isomerase FklB